MTDTPDNQKPVTPQPELEPDTETDPHRLSESEWINEKRAEHAADRICGHEWANI
jgi:hypothetical protein